MQPHPTRLGPVSQHAADLARQAVNSKGIVFWLDGDEQYTGLAEALATAHQAGSFPIPVLTFRGSFLELMLGLRAHGHGRHPSSVLVHLPGFNEARVHKTPALELYRAGIRFRPALETVIREAAVGHVAPSALDAFIDKGNLDLVTADAWLEQAAAVASGELGAWLEPHEPTTVLQVLLDAREKGDRFDSLEAEGRLEDWFERRLGVDRAWRAFAGRIGDSRELRSDLRSTSAHLAPITHALCVEYVFDLRREPAMPELAALRRLPAELVEQNRAVARWLRQDDPRRYESLANDLESRIKEEAKAAVPEDLGEVDTFRFEEATLLAAAIRALDENHWDKALSWALGRSEQASFWARKDLWRQGAWRLIARAAELGRQLDAAHDRLSIPWHVQEDAMNAYARLEDGDWRGDAAHRALEAEFAVPDPRLPHYDKLQDAVGRLRNAWQVWADELARKAASLCEERGPLPDPQHRLRSTFRRSVRALLDAHPRQKVAYILLDGFRYELAAGLLQALSVERGVDAELTPRMAPGPTDTWLCMNALALDQDGTQPLVVQGVGSGAGVRAGTFAITDPESRRRAMREAAGLKQVSGLHLDETLELAADALAHRVRAARLVVVQTEEPDKTAEAGSGLGEFERVSAKVRSAVSRLRDAGVQHFVITTDHGFLIQHPDAWAKFDFGKKTDGGRRVALHPAPAPEKHLLLLSPRQLELAGVDGTLVFPRTVALFDQGKKRKNYAHGGMSLQERVVPVLRVTHRNPKGGSTLTYGLELQSMTPLPGISRVRGTLRVADTGMLAFGGDETLELALRVPDRPDVEVIIVSSDHATTAGGLVSVQVDREFQLFLKLTGPRDEKVRLQVFDPSGRGRLEPVLADGWFDAIERIIEHEREDSAVPRPLRPVEVAPDDSWLDVYEEDGLRAIFAHIHEHGSITEAECTRFLGSPRRFRKFSRTVETHARHAPFDLRVETAASGKRYVREGAS